jgi:hypothetical protein
MRQLNLVAPAQRASDGVQQRAQDARRGGVEPGWTDPRRLDGNG